MTKTGGQGKGKPGRHDKGFGQALIKRQLLGKNGDDARGGKSMMSVLDSNALDDFVATAVLHDDEVEVKRVHNHDSFLVQPTVHKNLQTLSMRNFDYEHLRIPRKPAWSRSMSAAQIDTQERNAFLEWRREIATMEAANGDRKATPFEKNLEVWRQLWRVVEKSDILIQIVDARNPTLYFSRDLMKYASEQKPPKPMMLLINKADFLTDFQRQVWTQHLNSLGIKFAFYSAQMELNRLEREACKADKAAEREERRALRRQARRAAAGLLPDERPLPSARAAHEDAEEEEEEEDGSDASENDEDEDDDDLYEEEEEAEEDVGLEARQLTDEEAFDNVVSLVDDIAEFWVTDVMPHIDQLTLRPKTAAESATADGSAGSVFVFGEAAASDSRKSAPEPAKLKGAVSDAENAEKVRRNARVLTRKELELFLVLLPDKLGITAQSRHGDRLCVGLLGFPNVGKSSVINTLMCATKSTHGIVRVGVSSTPGKTKHFQTLMVSDRLMLCDCPGLVFPSFMNSTGEMLCSGILPINQMRDYVSPAQVIASRIPMHLLDACYGIHIKRDLDIKDSPDRPPTAHELLCAYCALKGYITNGTGRWDEFRACKDLLRDFNDGRILFVAPPTAVDGTVLTNESRWLMETERTMIRNDKIAERLAVARIKEADEQAEADRKAKEAEDQRIARATASNASTSEMVFGDGKYQFIEDEEALLYGGVEIDEDGNIIESSEIATEGGEAGKPKRDHKRLKTWGKKNKKLREKNPYGEENGKVAYVALSTNRVNPLAMGAPSAVAPKVKRHDPRQAYGSPYVRTTLPHHPSAAHRDPIAAAKEMVHSRGTADDDVSAIKLTR